MTFEEIRRVPILSGLDPAVLRRYVSDRQVFLRQYAKGATVHRRHDACGMMDIVLSGNLAAYSLSENGSAVTMFSFQQNSIIGANLLFGDRHTYPLDIYAVTDCKLIHVTQNAVAEFLHAYSFVMQYVQSLSRNSLGMNRKISMLTQKTLRENLLDYLGQQAALQKSSAVVLPISKRELADYLGVQRPSLFRELKKLKEEGILAVDHRTIRVLR